MRVKTAKLTGAALDWAVARCELGPEGILEIDDPHFYSTDWAQGGPIIERERLELKPVYAGWAAFLGNMYYASGLTPLIAAMRCYVASKLGDKIEIPDELM